MPTRRREGADSFVTGTYLTEARVPEGSATAGKTLRDLESDLEEADAQIVGLIRNERRIPAPGPHREVRAGDILVIEAEPEALAGTVESLELQLEEDVRDEKAVEDDKGRKSKESPTSNADDEADTDDKEESSALYSKEIELAELAVRPRAELVGRSMQQIRLRERYGINLLAVSREGRRSAARLRSMAIVDGDVLLVQGPPAAILEFANRYGCVPLAERTLRIPDRRKALMAAMIMAASVAGAAFGLVPAAIAFAAGVLVAALVGVIPVRQLYDAIDWPVIVLLAALIPVAGAMATTGAADVLAKAMIGGIAGEQHHDRAGAGAHHHDVPLGFHEQRRDCGRDVPDRDQRCVAGRRQRRSVPDGRRGRRVMRVPHADRPSEQYADPRARRVSLR